MSAVCENEGYSSESTRAEMYVLKTLGEAEEALDSDKVIENVSNSGVSEDAAEEALENYSERGVVEDVHEFLGKTQACRLTDSGRRLYRFHKDDLDYLDDLGLNE